MLKYHTKKWAYAMTQNKYVIKKYSYTVLKSLNNSLLLIGR